MTTTKLLWLAGLVTSLCVALLGQAELLGEPWRHVVTVAGIVGTVVSTHLRATPSPWDGEDRRERPR